MSVTAFNTIQHCIDNTIPCFTFPMDASKKLCIKWSQIDSSNFYSFLNTSHNGFAIITGGAYIMIDIDMKHTPPPAIYTVLEKHCAAIEKTPGGFHFWFKSDPRTAHFKSVEAAYWDGAKIKGLDIRAKGGIAYCAPSNYIGLDGSPKKYEWMKGNLSTASVMDSEVLEHLDMTEPTAVETASFTFTLTRDPETASTQTTTTVANTVADIEEEDISAILAGLSDARVDNYDSWIRVGMALHNCGYPCELWDTWSKRSTKYRPGTCFSKWRSFHLKESPITMATLYKWLKEDNYEVFMKLQGERVAIQTNLLYGTNAHIANIFHSMNPHSYIYSHIDGWYALQENGTWLAIGSTDVMKIPNILNAVRNECLSLLMSIFKQNGAKTIEPEKLKQMGEVMKRVSTASFLKGVLAFLSGLYYVKDVEKQFNERRDLFAFSNGVLDMKTLEFRAIEPTDYITVTCGYPYREPTSDEKAMVRGCLASMFPHEAVLEYILRALSTTFEGENRGEFFHALTGVGANGKSCLMDLCKVVFGDYFRTIGVTYLTKEDDGKDRPLPDLVDARWARMLVASEPEERDKLQVALLKLISGNDEIGCRAMYGKTVVKYRPQFKLWILTNDMPKLSKFDQGIERRMRCVHFPVRFVANPVGENERKRDEGLKGRILGEEGWRYGFLGLLLEAFARGRGEVLSMPNEVREFTEAYMLENNPVGAWLRANYEMTGLREDCIVKGDLLKAFVAATGITKTQKAFYEDIAKCNVQEKKTMGKREFYGLKPRNIIIDE